MSDLYGLIDFDGNILNKKGNYSVTVQNKGKNFILRFKQDMRHAVVSASPRFFTESYMFDHECSPIVVSNAPDGDCKTLGFSNCNAEHENMGFSFNIYL